MPLWMRVATYSPRSQDAFTSRILRNSIAKRSLVIYTCCWPSVTASTPVMVEAFRLVHEGKIGKVYGVEVHIIADQTRLTAPGYRNEWRAQKARAGGGHLIWLGIHWLDLAMWVTGLPVKAVTGFTANVGGQPLDVEDSAVVAMQFENGSLGTLTSGYYLDKGYHSHLKVWGSQGWLQVHKHTEIPLEWYSMLEPNPQVRRWEKPKRATGDVYPLFVRLSLIHI